MPSREAAPLLNRAGIAATVPAAPSELKARCDIVTEAEGGRGAVREVIEIIVRSSGHLDAILERYL